MTTTFNYQRRYIRPNRKDDPARKLSLYSPLALLVLVTLVFAFFITAADGPAYMRNAGQEATVGKEVKSDPVIMYQKVVTNADAIRSVLQ
jgi:hypothetical protein